MISALGRWQQDGQEFKVSLGQPEFNPQDSQGRSKTDSRMLSSDLCTHSVTHVCANTHTTQPYTYCAYTDTYDHLLHTVTHTITHTTHTAHRTTHMPPCTHSFTHTQYNCKIPAFSLPMCAEECSSPGHAAHGPLFELPGPSVLWDLKRVF